MTKQQKLEKASRLLYYKQYNYNPSIEEIIQGLSYEYRTAFCRKQLTPNAWCTEWQMWKEGKWGTAFGYLTKEELMENIKKRNVRVKNVITSSDLKKILEEVPLVFELDDLTLTVVGRKRSLTPLLYINGVNEEVLRAYPNTKLYKKWFSNKMGVKRVEAELGHLLFKTEVRPLNNTLYKYLKCSYTKPIENLDVITQNFIKQVKTDKKVPESAKTSIESETKLGHITYGKIKEIKPKQYLRLHKTKQVMGVNKHHKKVKSWSKEAQVNLDAFNAKKELQKKKSKSKHNPEKLVCITRKEEYKKVKRKDLGKHLKDGWKTTSKSSYKSHIGIISGESTPNPPQGLLRAQRRYKEPKKGKGFPNATIQKVHKIMNSEGKLVGIKTDRVDSKGFLLDDKGNKMYETITRTKRIPIYKMDRYNHDSKVPPRRKFVEMKEVDYSYKRPIRLKVHTITTRKK